MSSRSTDFLMSDWKVNYIRTRAGSSKIQSAIYIKSKCLAAGRNRSACVNPQTLEMVCCKAFFVLVVNSLIILSISLVSAFPSLGRTISSFLKLSSLCKVTLDPKCNFKEKTAIDYFIFSLDFNKISFYLLPLGGFHENKRTGKKKNPRAEVWSLSYTFLELKQKCGEI